jgi:flagellum-specific peptidoglycan hydrolase FlgJ
MDGEALMNGVLTPQQIAFLKLAADAAVKAGTIPPELTLPQAILESGWGQHCPGQNCFGIKSRPGEPYTRKMTTEFIHGQEVHLEQDFESFATLADAFARHNQLIKNAAPYHAAIEQYQADGDIPALIRGVAVHYATDPNYADKILALSQRPDVVDAIAKARAEAL